MSAPDPKAWEITEQDWNFPTRWLYSREAIQRLAKSIARRRAIAELLALKDNPSWVTYGEIDARIAAIEAEEA